MERAQATSLDAPRNVNRCMPSMDTMLAWLQSDQVVLADGAVLSWSNPAHPGYRYPEVAGLLLSFLAGAEVGEGARDRIVRGLLGDLSSPCGFGKDSRLYLFDTAVVLSGLLAYQRAGGRLPGCEPLRRLFEFIAAALAARRATHPPEPQPPERWSLCYGSHLLKLVQALDVYRDAEGDPRSEALINQLLDDLLPLCDGGRFRIHENSRQTYLHAHCYAIEGLMYLSRRGLSHVQPVVLDCGRWLAQIQEANGGIPSWHDGYHCYGDCHADATAQAVRIWACLDSREFAAPIESALGFLARLQSPAGGIWYRPGSRDVNTWSTIFAAQALRWANDGPSGDLLL